MKLNTMKYKNYIWPHNPSSINISVTRDLKEFKIPFQGNVFQDFGIEKRIVSGTGEFFGEDCISQFETLFSVFKQSDSGYLELPGMKSFLAVFNELYLTGTSTPNLLTYKFEFLEDLSSNVYNYSNNTSEIIQDEYYTVLNGDTLWSIALKFNLTVEYLLNLNPNIKNPNQLTVGEKVRLK